MKILYPWSVVFIPVGITNTIKHVGFVKFLNEELNLHSLLHNKNKYVIHAQSLS